MLDVVVKVGRFLMYKDQNVFLLRNVPAHMMVVCILLVLLLGLLDVVLGKCRIVIY